MTNLTLEQIAQNVAKEIEIVTEGAEAEVTFTGDEALVYTEDLEKELEIVNFMKTARPYIRRSFYEAEDDMPAGVTLFFSMDK